MANEIQKPIDKLKQMLSAESVQEQFKNALADNAPLFTASLIDLYNGDNYLQKCDPKAVIMEALKAATLKLPINKNLGFAYIVPYKNSPQFQMGYRGYIQLALRTGQYRYINAGILYEGQRIEEDILTGEIAISGTPKNDNAIAYFAYLEMLNGFKKTICWSKERVIAHAKKYSKSFNNDNSAWKTNFDGMSLKTMLRNLLGKYGMMTVEMSAALSSDHDERSYEEQFNEEIAENANKEVIDIETGEVTEEPAKEAEKKPEPELVGAGGGNGHQGPDF